MKKLLSSAAFVLAVWGVFCATTSAQGTNPRVGPTNEEESAVVRESDPKAPAKNRADENSPANPQKNGYQTPPDSSQSKRKDDSPTLASSIPGVSPASGNTKTTSDAPSRLETPSTSFPGSIERKSNAEAGADSPSRPVADPAPLVKPVAAAPTSIYRIGTGDVLDIRLLNLSDSRQSTLFTVLAGGIIEYPQLTHPVTAEGLTPEELALQLIADLRHRGIHDKPLVRVSVREYSSHAVLVSGLVSDPGTKILRREAIPLYVVIAEAQPKPEAGRAVVMSHSTGKTTNVDLSDAAAMSLLVQRGDVINVVVRPPEFFYVGGEINAPGQKNFHMGITLTQALLASGGVTKLSGPTVRVSRQGADGRLVFAEYNLKEIEDGLLPDPALQPGDRIEVSLARVKK